LGKSWNGATDSLVRKNCAGLGNVCFDQDKLQMANLSSVLNRLLTSIRFGLFRQRNVFDHIYKTRYWGDRESVSGPGSSLVQTLQVRENIPTIMKKFSIKKIFDAPCGDLNWMHKIADQLGADYVGGDIVQAVVDAASSRLNNPSAKLIKFDIVTEEFPDADMWICRDVLFHFSYKNIKRTLKNFERSKVSYVLVTSHIGTEIKNRPIVTGDFRQLNLFLPPFKLTDSDVMYRFDDYSPPHNPREMILLRREVFCGML
jgi:hypothetical protein